MNRHFKTSMWYRQRCPVFWWDGDCRFGGVDFDDPTTNVRGRRALAIAKPTPRGYWPRRSTINLTTRVYFLRANEEQARNRDCNLDIANIRWNLYWSKWGSVTSWSGRWTQTKYAKLQLWRTFNLNKTQGKATRWIYLYRSKGWRPRRWEDVPSQPKTKSRSYKANGPKWRWCNTFGLVVWLRFCCNVKLFRP